MQKGKPAEHFGSFLEIAALGGLTLHILVVILSAFVGSFGADPGSNFSISQKQGFGLLAASFILYGLLTVFGRCPLKFNYLQTIDETNAAGRQRPAQMFLIEIKAEVTWLFALISLQMAENLSGEFGGLINFSVFLIILVISTTTIGYALTIWRLSFKSHR